jgi:RNA polymerase sigma-70 factor (ECF subfamily)
MARSVSVSNVVCVKHDASHPAGSGHGDDFVLVTRLCRGDPDAFAAIIRQHLDTVTRFAAYLAGSRDAADDVVQSVFVQLWEQRTALDPTRPIKPYLFRAVHNRALDERKSEHVRERHRTAVQTAAESGSLPSAVPSPENVVLMETDISSALVQLPERRQTAVRLRFEAQMTHAEIGDVMGVSAPAAMQLVLRGIEDIRRILGV